MCTPASIAIREFDLRTQFKMNWGLTDTPVPGDFHNPPTLTFLGIVDEQPQPQQHKPKLRHRLRKLAQRVVSFTLAGGGSRVRSKLMPPSSAVTVPRPSSKDFSYGSGERQTADDYAHIRRDHQARYELAHQLLPRDISVLDLFFGNAYGSFLLAETREVTGIDGSATAIKVADRCFKRSGSQFASCCYPFEDGSECDAIVSYESIEHVPDGGEFFRFLVQHLRPGGWILYSTPNENLLPFNRNVHIHHHRHYTHGETLEFARSGGLMIEDWYGQDVYKSITEGPPALLAEDDMEPKRGISGQFTAVVARKPTSRAA